MTVAFVPHAQELDQIVEAVFPLVVGQDRLEPLTIKRMRLPPKCWWVWCHTGAPPIADDFLWRKTPQSLPAWPKQLEWKHLGSLKQPGMRRKVETHGPIDRRKGDAERLTPEPRDGPGTEKKAGELKTTTPDGLCCTPLSIGKRRERTVVHDE